MFKDNDIALFTIAQHAGRDRLVFTTLATLRAGVPGQTPLWWFEPRTNEQLAALSVWLGEQRGLWPAWREISERYGAQALADEIGRLWSLEPIESCCSVMMTPGDDPRELALLAMLVTRRSEFVRHRFASARHRRVFTEWYLRDISANAAFLLYGGCLVGPKHLGRVLDRIARAEMSDSRQARARRASRPRHKAA